MTAPDLQPAAFVFPGQGPQESAMVQTWTGSPLFERHRSTLNDLAGLDLLTEVQASDGAILARNRIVSLVTVFTSVIELQRLRDGGIEPAMVAGYSVGQLTAMFAAGMLSLEQTLDLVAKRAERMDRSRSSSDGAMLAVIGLATPKVEEVCLRLREDGNYVIVSNYNCQGQLTLAGTRAAIDLAEQSIQELGPRKLARVPVQGAWHCALLEDVVDDYRSNVLDALALNRAACPVMDNVSGEPLPEEPDQIRASLARHLVSPVRWDQCMRTMIDAGAESFVEVGYGNMLTKFGFFIDRKKRHLPSSGID